MYQGSGNPTGDTSISFKVQLQNTGSGTQDLSQVTIRYYFTADGGSGFSGQINSAGMNLPAAPYFQDIKTSVSQMFGTPAAPSATADSYLELDFAAGTPSLPAGGTLVIDNQFHGPNYSTHFTQTNDYSYDGTATAFKATNTITLYVGGVLMSGMEP
jgi:cellulose 1,4-beta-cellobiosidase